MKATEAKSWIESQFNNVASAMKFGVLKLSFKYEDFVETDHRWSNDTQKLLGIHVLTPYRMAEIEVSPTAVQMVQEGDDGKWQVLNALVHELCHVHVAVLADIASNRFVTTQEMDTRVEELTEVFADYVRENLRLKAQYKISIN